MNITFWRLSSIALLIAAFVVSVAHSQSNPASTPEDRGKLIYTDGISENYPTAWTGSGAEVSAIALPCVNCHGVDGRGEYKNRHDAASDITWAALTNPEGVTYESGRTRPPYTESTFMRAIRHGKDPAGNTLHARMPRYLMLKNDMKDLVAYLKTL